MICIVWEVAAEAERKKRQEKMIEQSKVIEEVNARKEEMKKEQKTNSWW